MKRILKIREIEFHKLEGNVHDVKLNKLTIILESTKLKTQQNWKTHYNINVSKYKEI